MTFPPPARTFFEIHGPPLPPIIIPAVLKTQLWRAHCHCGHVITGRRETIVNLSAVEHHYYAHVLASIPQP